MIYVDKTDIAWAAGFFDGEGCIRINKTKNQYILQIFTFHKMKVLKWQRY